MKLYHDNAFDVGTVVSTWVGPYGHTNSKRLVLKMWVIMWNTAFVPAVIPMAPAHITYASHFAMRSWLPVSR